MAGCMWRHSDPNTFKYANLRSKMGYCKLPSQFELCSANLICTYPYGLYLDLSALLFLNYADVHIIFVIFTFRGDANENN